MLRVEFELNKHEVKQMFPAIKDHVTGQGTNVIKERLSRAKFLPHLLIDVVSPVEHGMEEKSKEVKRKEQG